MTIYTRQYDEYGGIQAVLIVAPGDTGLLAGTLLDYDKRGKLVSIAPNTPITPLELDRSWTLMCEPGSRTKREHANSARHCYECDKVIPYFGLGSMCVDCIAKHSTEPLLG